MYRGKMYINSMFITHKNGLKADHRTEYKTI